ncbi:SAC3/GANP/Nin1/mts3/eIF-3 p25 family-domain-containing protein [Paraphysoderma sedebokerense]|nr:SAC3/GANP/Nin1/mts3/eIF-3 p25 family-domain-containing protein [Paraphysoderma sedebokerense]
MSRQPQRNSSRLFSSAVKNTVLPSFRNPHLRRRTPSQDSNLSDAASSSTISTATTPMPQITQDMSEQEAKELRALRFARNVDPEFEKMKEERQKRINYLTENPIQYGKDNPLIGKCLKKCPDYQIRERIVNNQVDMLEKDPSSGQPDPDRFVSKFSRSDAGTNKILEDEVRPPHILKQTVDYLFNDLLRTHGFWNCHHFIRDRCRAIRIEFTYQADIEKELNVQCQERIARFHIYSIHQLRGLPPDERGSLKLEAEQLQKILMTLIELYDELQSRDIISPNEAEFRAYYLIFFPTTTTKRRFLRTLSPQILHHPTLVHAMKLVEPLTTPPSINNLRPVAAQNFGTKFIRLMKSTETPYLMSCLCEIHLDTVRMAMLKTLTYTTKNSNKGGMASLKWLQGLLELPTLDDTVEFIKKFRIPYYESDPNVVYFGKTFQGTKIWKSSPTSLLQTELISPNCPELEGKLPQDVSMSDVLNGKVGVHYTSTTASTSASLTFAEKYGKNPVLGDKVIAGGDSSRMASPNVERTDNRNPASSEKVHDVAPITSGEQSTIPSNFTLRKTDINPQRTTDVKPQTDSSTLAVNSPIPASSKTAAFPATAIASSVSSNKTIPSTFGVVTNVPSTSISPAQATIPLPITAKLAEKTVDHSKATESSSKIAASAASLSFTTTTQT